MNNDDALYETFILTTTTQYIVNRITGFFFLGMCTLCISPYQVCRSSFSMGKKVCAGFKRQSSGNDILCGSNSISPPPLLNFE